MSSRPSSLITKWEEHLNSVWTCERSDNIATREYVQQLYDRLLANKVSEFQVTFSIETDSCISKICR